MKKVNKVKATLFALIALLAVSVTCFAGISAKAETDPNYRFDVSEYTVIYDIGKDCSIEVSEYITVDYKGYYSTGFIRDIPVNGGAQVRDVKVSKIVDNNYQSVWYDVYFEDNNFVSVDIGDSTNKFGRSESYCLTYTYNINHKDVRNGILPLNPVGTGWDCTLSNVTVKMLLPEGYKSAECFYGERGSTDTLDFVKTEIDGRTALLTYADYLPAKNGITFQITFEEGVLTNFNEFTPFYFIIAAVIVLAVLILLRLFVFNKDVLTPVVNYSAPNEMDPLMMGKLIDNRVDSEDVTSLLYYWADKGFIKINLDDKNDPSLIRIVQTLPESYPKYQHLLYDRMFGNNDAIRPSELRNTYYVAVNQATNIVNKQTKGLYNNKSIALSLLFTFIGGLLLSLAPIIIAVTAISSKMFMLLPFVAMVPPLVIYAFTETIMYNKLKFKKRTLALMSLGLIGICLLSGLIYVVLVPSGIIDYLPKILLFVVCCAISVLSVMLVSRTESYRKNLNNIIGFKKFIELAEKNQLEMLLEEDPQFYYHILPYAQVLGVTDKWEHKFDDLTVSPPDWLAGDLLTGYIQFSMLNSIMRSSMGKMSSAMVSSPSSSGMNGGFGSGGGGFSGGGFGGGGGRGR